MDIKQEMQGVPRALRATWEDSRPQYVSLVRRVNWSGGPIYVTGSSASYLAGITGAYAFESLLGLPVIVRPPAAFSAFTGSALAPRSLLIAIADSGECPLTLEAVEHAKKRGATVWAVTRSTSSPLAGLADGMASLQAGETPADGAHSVFIQHATMLVLALVTTRAVKKPTASIESIENEFDRLPGQIDWLNAQMADAARSLAAELKDIPALLIAGGGFHHPIALQISHDLAQLTGIRTQGFDLADQQTFLADAHEECDSLIVASGSRSKLKAHAHEVVREAKRKKIKVFAITDPNDPQLSERANLAILLPVFTEPVSALLNFALLNLVLHYAGRETGKKKSNPTDASDRVL